MFRDTQTALSALDFLRPRGEGRVALHRATAAAVLGQIADPAGHMALFGPGQGRLLRALTGLGVRPQQLSLFEVDPTHVAGLRDIYPMARLYHAGAHYVDRLCCPDLAAVISRIPLESMAAGLQHAILAHSFQVLRAGGVFVQLTRSRAPFVDAYLLAELGLSARPVVTLPDGLRKIAVHTLSRRVQ